MRITANGQVTIPPDIRERAGLLPNTEVQFSYDGSVVTLRPVPEPNVTAEEMDDFLKRMAGRGDVDMTTDEIMALTRGE